MADNLTISIGADSGRLRAELAVAQSSLRAFTREMNSAANAARKTGSDLSFSQASQAAAQVNRLTSEVARLKTEMGEASEAVRGMEAIGEGAEKALTTVTSMKGAFRELGEAVGIYLVAERLADWTSEAAEAAEETRNFASAVGIAADSYSNLQGAMKLAGGDAETMGRALTMLQQRTAEALKTGGGQAYDAFRAMGLSDSDMKQSADKLIAIMADAWQRMGNTPARTAAFGDVFGSRQLANMVHLLDGGKAHIDELVDRAKQLGLALGDPALNNLSEMAEKTHELAGAWEGLKNTVATTFSGSIIGQMQVFTNAIVGYTELLKAHGQLPGPSTNQSADWLKVFANSAADVGASVRHGMNSFYGGELQDYDYSGHGELIFRPPRQTPMERLRALRGEDLTQGGALTNAQKELAFNNFAGMMLPGTHHLMQFATPDQGIEAIGNQLDLYQSRYGVKTLGGMVSRWAPPEDHNDTPALIARASRITGIAPNANVDLQDADTRLRTIEAIVRNERGGKLPAAAAGALNRMPRSFGQGSIPAYGAANKAMLAQFDERIATAREKAQAGGGLDALKKAEDAKTAYVKLQGDARDAYLKAHAPEQTAEALKSRAASNREMTSLNLEYYDADTHNKIVSLKEQQAAAQDIGKKIALQHQIITTEAQRRAGRPTGPGIGDNTVEEARRQLAALQREQSVATFRQADQDYGALHQRNTTLLRGYTAAQGAAVDAQPGKAAAAIRNEIALTQQYAAEEMAVLQHAKELAAASGNDAEQKKVANQILQAQAATMTQVLDLQKKLADDAKKTAAAWAAPFKTAISSIGSDLDKTVTDLLLRRGSLASIGKQAYQGVVGSAVNLGGSLLSKGGAAALGASGGQGMGEFLSGKILNMLGLGTQTPQIALQTMANSYLASISASTAITAGNTAASATTGGVSALSAAGSAGGFLSGIPFIGSAASWIGGLFGGGITAASTVPSAAGLIAAAAFSRGGIVPAAAGGWSVPGFGTDTVPARLTPGETVLPLGERPSHIAAQLGDKIDALSGAGGDMHLHLHSQVMDGPSVDRWFSNLVSRNPDALRKLLRSNALTPRTI